MQARLLRIYAIVHFREPYLRDLKAYVFLYNSFVICISFFK